ncbi:pectin lyase-like protein [Hymenopellis radicata]|nr:pectin lyase-like protein [Hymenopellis radicata]
MFSKQIFSLVAVAVLASANPLERRTATNVFPTPPTTSSLSSPITVKAGETFTTLFGVHARVVIGANQAEGVHCLGSCTLDHVFFEDVCEDAITIKQTSGTSRINYGGAKHASDKVVQHNGGGVYLRNRFYVEDFGKLYRSRTVQINDVWAVDGSALVGINTTATIRTTQVDDVNDICVRYTGNDDGDEPTKTGSGPDGTYCKYTTSDITEL